MRSLFPLANPLTTKMSAAVTMTLRTNTLKSKKNPKTKIMKTSSKTHDGPEAKPKHITGHDLTDNNASEKASSYFLKEHHSNEISSKQIFSLKKKLTLLITIAIALAAFLMTACEPEPEPCSNCLTVPPGPAPNTTPPTDPDFNSFHSSNRMEHPVPQ